jgi:ATP-dependent DNA helicase RecQ
VTEEDWANAKAKLTAGMSASNKLPLANALIQAFESVTPARKFKSDWKAFLHESKIEDYEKIDNETIFVSTIHKAKGKEFDNVVLFADRFNDSTDDAKRKFYVAITRAKSGLHIHYNSGFLRDIEVEGISRHPGPEQFDAPDLLSFSLTHSDVQLWYFEYVQWRIAALYSGAPLKVVAGLLANSQDKPVANKIFRQ